MKKFSIITLLLFTIFFASNINSYSQDVVVLGTSHINDNLSGVLNDINVGFNNADFTDSNWQQALTGNLGTFNALIAAESYFDQNGGSLSTATNTQILNYVQNGGCLIAIGDHDDDESSFLNSIFGYSTTGNSTSSDESVTGGTIQAGATGTVFQGGPGEVRFLDLTTALTNTPGTTIYESAGGSVPAGVLVFFDQVGSGNVIWLGWDYCCGNSQSNIDDWAEVLRRALLLCPNVFVVEPAPTLSEWGFISFALLSGLTALWFIRRKQVLGARN
ncbi:MAG: IPTL-CTERM sorting domain-containing protein [Thermodesulfobacteriota bacterium]